MNFFFHVWIEKTERNLWRILFAVLTISTSLMVCSMYDWLPNISKSWLNRNTIYFYSVLLLCREKKNETATTIANNIVTHNINRSYQCYKKSYFVISTIHSIHTHTHFCPPFSTTTVYFSLFLLFLFLAAMPNCKSERTHERTIINKRWRLTVNRRLNATHTHTQRARERGALANGGSTMWMTKIAWCDRKFDIGSRFYTAVDSYVAGFWILHIFTHRWRHSSFLHRNLVIVSFFLDSSKLFFLRGFRCVPLTRLFESYDGLDCSLKLVSLAIPFTLHFI